MGKRATNTTKSGKFMNPTDQARKEQRKKELKKNKKQRALVRTAVLKGKNPREIILELEKLDDMEFNVMLPPPLNDKVLKEKRRKLHETWHRVIKMYEKDDNEQYAELKKIWHSYQNRKHEVIQHYESVKNAQNVQVDEIPLPNLAPGEDGGTESIPLPPGFNLQPKGGILKKPSALETLKQKTCPGVPAMPPPRLADYDDEDDKNNKENNEEPATKRAKTIRFEGEEKEDEENKDEEEEDMTAPGEESGPQVDDIQKKMLRMAGQDVDQYMKEMEEVHKLTQAEKQADLNNRLSKLEGSLGKRPGQPNIRPQVQSLGPGDRGAPPPPPAHMMMHPRPPIMYRPAPPPLRPGMAPSSVRLPPGPPPGLPQAPPGPPPGRPPAMVRPGPPRMPIRPLLQGSGGVVSAAPQINKESGSTAGKSVIEAKPQMRNLKSDITRFVPTNVKVKREGMGKKRHTDPLRDVFKPSSHQPQSSTSQQPKDDAYAQFMKEMDSLMK